MVKPLIRRILLVMVTAVLGMFIISYNHGPSAVETQKAVETTKIPVTTEVPVVEESTTEVVEETTEIVEETTTEVAKTTEPTTEVKVETTKEHIVTTTKKVSIKKPESSWNGVKLNAYNGMIEGPSGTETYYNLDMSGVIRIMKNHGYDYEYSVREDGVKLYGGYVMVAANLNLRPRGTIIETSLGTGIVCDTGDFAYSNPTQLDIAVNW